MSMNADDLRTLGQKLYCYMTYNKFKEFYTWRLGSVGDDYIKEKWERYQKDFFDFFCNLSSSNARCFLDFVFSDEFMK